MDNDIILLMEARAAARDGNGKAIRTSAGLSQSELARAIGVTPATMCRWESGARVPRGPAAIRYAQVLRLLPSN